MKAIVCLGNKGPEYEYTRHNVGFCVADKLVAEWGLSAPKSTCFSDVHSGIVEGKKVVVLKPQTYMNASGKAVSAYQQYYKLAWSDILIVYDDFDVMFGAIRLRPQGSAGTHNGLKSVLSLAGTSAIARLRVGVGPLDQHLGVSDFVLQQFTTDQRVQLPQILTGCVRVIHDTLHEGIHTAMNRFNGVNLLDPNSG